MQTPTKTKIRRRKAKQRNRDESAFQGIAVSDRDWMVVIIPLP